MVVQADGYDGASDGLAALVDERVGQLCWGKGGDRSMVEMGGGASCAWAGWSVDVAPSTTLIVQLTLRDLPARGVCVNGKDTAKSGWGQQEAPGCYC